MSNDLRNKLIIILEAVLFISALLFLILNNFALNVALGVVIIAILIPFFIIFPYYALLLLIIVRNSTDIYAENIFINIGITTLNFSSILGIMIIVWGIYVILTQRISIKKIPLTIPWILFLIMCFSSTIYSLDKISSIKLATKFIDFYFLYTISYFYFTQARERQDRKIRNYFILAILISFVIPVIFGIYQLIFNVGYIGPEGLNRVFGTFTHPNIFSFTLLLLFFILLILYKNTKNPIHEQDIKSVALKIKEKSLYVFLIFLTIFLLLSTYTRSAWIGALIFFGFYIIFFHKNKIFSIIYYVFAISFVFFLLINYTSLKYYDFNNINFIRRITTSETSVSSTDWRLNTWKEMKVYVYESPFIGFGLDTYRLLREKQVTSPYESPYYAHNDYLQLLIELGLVGLILYLNLIFQTLYRIYKKYLQKKDKTILLSLLGIIIIFSIGFVDNIFMSTSLQWLLWVYIAFLIT